MQTKHAMFYMLMVGLFSSTGASAGNQSTANEVCDGFYGVTKSNCIQQFNAGWFKDGSNTEQSPSANAKMEPCDGLYGVTKSNCIQLVHSRWYTEAANERKSAAAIASMGPCDGFYGVTKTNCLQSLRTQN